MNPWPLVLKTTVLPTELFSLKKFEKFVIYWRYKIKLFDKLMNAPLSINTGQEKRFNNRYKMALPCRRYKIIPNGSFVHLLFQQSISLPFHLFSFIVLTSSLTSIKFEINILITRFFHFLDSLIVEIILRLYQKHSTHSYFMLLRGFGVMKKSPKNSK